MGFLKGIFGNSKPGPAAPGRPMPQPGVSGSSSIAGLLVQQKAPLTPERCGTCGTTFMNPQWMFTLVTKQPLDFRLDVGGYCPRCSAYRCQQHTRLQNIERPNMRGLPDPSLKAMMWGMTCGSCGAALQPTPGIPTKDHALLVDGKLITGQQSGPKQEFASSSGKLSLAKVVENQHHLTLLAFNCSLCGAEYRHIPQMIGFGTSDGLTPEKFEVDVGGHCSQGCGNICPKHIRMGEHIHQGQKVIVPLCAQHGTPITPTP